MPETEWGPYFDENDEPELRTVSTSRGTFDVPPGFVLTFSEEDAEGHYNPILTKVAEPSPTKLIDSEDYVPIPPADEQPAAEPEADEEE